jgi:ribosome maturation factor RimP
MAVAEVNDKRSLEARIAGLAEQIAASMGMEIVLLEIKGEGNSSILRTYIDQPSGITLDDCERFSKRFSVALDVEDWIPFSYVMEISSPGVNRPLVKEADFQRFCGKNAKVRTRLPIEGQRSLKGRLAGVIEGKLTLEVSQEKRVVIALTDIEKASLIADLSMKPQGS